ASILRHRVRSANPRFFVVGCPRSGTTLLQRMLNSHPQLAVANDTHFIPAAIKGVTPRPDLPVTPEIVERVRRFRTGGGMGFHRPRATGGRAGDRGGSLEDVPRARQRPLLTSGRAPRKSLGR